MRDLGINYEVDESHVSLYLISAYSALICYKEYERVIAAAEDIGSDDPFPQQCLVAMKGLWKDDSVQRTIGRGNEYALHDNIQ